MTSSGWPASRRRTSGWSARTRASRSGRTARRRWRSKTWGRCARAIKGSFVSVEAHCPEGGLGAAVLEAFAAEDSLHVAHLAVKGLPTSGKPEELMNAAGISARHIVAAATKLLAGK